MDQVMRIPFKVSTTTSNFMIGVTAAASAGVYLRRGYINPGLSMPVMLGVLAGSLAGTRILLQAETKWLRLVFSLIILLLGAQMIYNGVAEASTVPPSWHGWLHHTVDVPPTQEKVTPRWGTARRLRRRGR